MAHNRIDDGTRGDDNNAWDRLLKNKAPGNPPPADLLPRCLGTVPDDRAVFDQASAWLKAHADSTVSPLLAGLPTCENASPVNGHAKEHGHNGKVNGNHNGHVPRIFTANRPQGTNAKGRRRWLLPLSIAAGLLLAITAVWQIQRSAGTAPGGGTIAEIRPLKTQSNEHKSNEQQDAVPPRNPIASNQNRPVTREATPPVNRPEPPALVFPPDSELVKSGPPKDPAALIQAQIAVGEFAPAVETARKIDRLELRDQWLAQIAVAQSQAGQRRASIDTIRQIDDDQTRTAALNDIAPLSSRNGGARNGGGRNGGGGAQADFDSLIELITSTVAPQSWDEVGGRGSIQPFPTGVYIDPQGVLRKQLRQDVLGELQKLHAAALQSSDNHDVRREASPAKISLNRLEREAQLRRAAGLPPDDDMRYLAGLRKIEYVLVYPETGDLVLAGPAGDWKPSDGKLGDGKQGDGGSMVSTETGRPVLQLDDLVVILRHAAANPNGAFGCLIKPQEEQLAHFKKFSETTSKKSLEPSAAARTKRLEELRSALGRQLIEVAGIDPETRVARVLVEADYRMKLVGIGLEDGTLDIPSCLELFKRKVDAGSAPPAMDVLRLWFTLNYQAVLASPERLAFGLRGPGVKVLSENQFLTEDGKRLPTGQSDPLYQEFAANFTRHIDALAAKYPVYADLQNICDLALVAALIESQDLAGQVRWHRTYFGDPQAYQVALGNAPKEVDTVANFVEVSRREIVFVVSGGVRVDPWDYVQREAVQTDKQGRVDSDYRRSKPGYAQPLPVDGWWWD